MRKTNILIFFILLGFQLISLSQNTELQLTSFSQNTDEIVDKLGTASKGTYLKDFAMDINPGEKASFSMVLSINTKYEFSYYEHETDQLQFNFYKDGEQKQESSNYVESLDSEKQSYDINPHKIIKLKNITQHEYIISETGIYHMFVKNLTSENLKTVVLLSFIERIKPIIEDETIIQTTSQENTQNKSKLHKDNPKEQYFFVVEEMPSFNGAKNIDKSKSEFLKFIEKEIKYPQEAIDKKIEGKVMVQFVIDKDGYIKEAKIVSGVHPALDQEALSVVYSSPRWQPGKQRGHKVMVVQTFPIEFKLP